MTKPKTRTVALEPATVLAVKRQFGTFANAYAQLMPGGQPLPWSKFADVAAGRLVTSATLHAFRTAYENWKRTYLK